MGASLGGYRALKEVFKKLPHDSTVPITVVIHRHHESDNSIVELMQKQCAMAVKEAEDKEPIQTGIIYIKDLE